MNLRIFFIGEFLGCLFGLAVLNFLYSSAFGMCPGIGELWDLRAISLPPHSRSETYYPPDVFVTTLWMLAASRRLMVGVCLCCGLIFGLLALWIDTLLSAPQLEEV